MSEPILDRPVSRAQFLRNTAKGGLALAVGALAPNALPRNALWAFSFSSAAWK